MEIWFINSRQSLETPTVSKRVGYNLNIIRQTVCLVLTQSWLIDMLHSLVARRWFRHQTYNDGFDVKLKVVGSSLIIFFDWAYHGSASVLLVLTYSIEIYSHEPSSLFHHSV